MAKWVEINRTTERIKGVPHSYVGWYRNHPKIHIYAYANEPAGKTSLVQVHQEGNRFTILAQTTAHGVFTQPTGTKGTTLFKKTVIKKTKASAMAEVNRLKKMLARKYDGMTGKIR